MVELWTHHFYSITQDLPCEQVVVLIFFIFMGQLIVYFVPNSQRLQSTRIHDSNQSQWFPLQTFDRSEVLKSRGVRWVFHWAWMGKMSRNSSMHRACLRIEMGNPPISAYFFPKSFISTFQVVKYNVNQRNHILYGKERRQEVIQTRCFSLEYLNSWLWFLFFASELGIVGWLLLSLCLFVFSQLSLLHSAEGEVKRRLPKIRILHQFYLSQLFHSSL